MINKQNLWFMTLFSLILVLSVYYITMPNDLLTTSDNNKSSVKAEVSEVSSLTAMRVSLEEERQSSIEELQATLTNKDITTDEKNNAYSKLKTLNQLQGIEEGFEKKIKKNYKKDCFVKIDNNNVSITCVSDSHDKSLANNIMRLIQKEYKDKLNITVKFQKS